MICQLDSAEKRTQVGPIYQGERYYAAVVRVEGAGVLEVWRCDAGTLANERRVCTTNVLGIAVRVAQGIQGIRLYGDRGAA